MKNTDIIDKTGKYLSSDECWSELMDFKTTNCVIFINEVSDPPEINEYFCYKSFIRTFINQIDCFLCQKLEISSDDFEKIVFESYKNGNAQAKIIVETIKDVMDFEKFRTDMINQNADGLDEMDDMIEELAQNDEMDDLNDEFLEKSIGKYVETSQNKTVTEKSQKICQEIEEKLNTTIKENSNESDHKIEAPEGECNANMRFMHSSPLKCGVIEPLGPIKPYEPIGGASRHDNVKRNNTAGMLHQNKMVRPRPPGIIKPMVIKNNHARAKTGKVVLPPLSTL